MDKKSNISVADLLSTCNSRAPIQDTINRRWDDIVVMLQNGHSRAKIADALASDGETVGNRRSGFNTALTKVANQKVVDLRTVGSSGRDDKRPVRAGGGELDPLSLNGAQAPSPGAGDGQPLPTTAPDLASRRQLSFADDRHPSDFGGE